MEILLIQICVDVKSEEIIDRITEEIVYKYNFIYYIFKHNEIITVHFYQSITIKRRIVILRREEQNVIDLCF